MAESPAALRATPLLSGLPEEPEELAKALETMVSRGGTDAWLEVLKAPGVWARRCRRYQGEPSEEDYAKARGITKREYHPGAGMLRTTHGAPRLSLTPTIPVCPSPFPGGDTERFMAEYRAKHPCEGKA